MNSGKKVTTPSGLVLEFSPVIAEKILTPADAAENGVQTDRHRVQLRQTVKTTYPSVRGNELFEADEFGMGPGSTYTESRVTWLNVPKTATVKQIQERLNQMDSPKLVRTLSLKPILSTDQVNAMERGINQKTYEQYLGDFVVNREGQPALFHGQKQYRKITFSKSFAEDEDNRGIDYQEIAKVKPFQIAAAEKAAVPAKI